MSKEWTKWLQQIFWGLAILSMVACDKISIPRLTWDQKPATKVPIDVKYQFDPRLSQHTQTVDACGLPYTIDSGKIITETFLRVGKERFTSVQEQPIPPTDETTPSSSNALTIDVQLVQFHFEPIGRSGEEDRFLTDVGLELQAIYRDPTGQPLAKTPLTYSEKTQLWAPALTSQSTSCSTGQFDAVVENAAETLALDMVNVVPQLYGQQPPPPDPETATYPATKTPSQSLPIQQPSVAFRTMLQDDNDNLVLEGGETLILKIETTNTSTQPLPSAYVELSGTDSIVEAFSQVTTLPIAVGALQPGEKKTTEVHGRMPETVETEKGELVISISLSQGIPPGAHKILAAIQPHQHNPQPTAATPTAQQSSQTGKQVSPTRSPYFAIVIALDEYREPWDKAYQFSDDHISKVLSTLYSTNTFPREHVRLLRGKHATRLDVEEALFTLAKHHLTPDATVFLYFGGHALIDQKSGEVYLAPYEGSVSGSKKRLISLRSLHRVLQKLNVKVTCLFLDTPIMQYLGEPTQTVGKNGSPPPNWSGDLLSAKTESDKPHLIQVRRLVQQDTQSLDQLLVGLSGTADKDKNGTVTLRELLDHVNGTAEILPTNSHQLPNFDIPLTQ